MNCLTVQDERGSTIGDGFDSLATGIPKPLSTTFPASSSPPESYTSQIPAYLKAPKRNHQHYTGEELVLDKKGLAEDVTNKLPTEPPPKLPVYCEKVILNSCDADPKGVDVTVLAIPNHTQINHLFACSIRDNVMSVACTSRYKKSL